MAHLEETYETARRELGDDHAIVKQAAAAVAPVGTPAAHAHFHPRPARASDAALKEVKEVLARTSS